VAVDVALERGEWERACALQQDPSWLKRRAKNGSFYHLLSIY
jgi:hypothetical protein